MLYNVKQVTFFRYKNLDSVTNVTTKWAVEAVGASGEREFPFPEDGFFRAKHPICRSEFAAPP
jgi:hypothetical protein